LIYDNCEEDPPYVHDVLIDWLPSFKSALIISMMMLATTSCLGADPNSAVRLQQYTKLTQELTHTFANSSELALVRSYLVPHQEKSQAIPATRLPDPD